MTVVNLKNIKSIKVSDEQQCCLKIHSKNHFNGQWQIMLPGANETPNFKKRGSIFVTKWLEDGKSCCCGILMKLMKSCTNSIFFLFVTFLFVCSTAHHSAQVLLYYYRNFLAYQLTYYIAFTTCTLHYMSILRVLHLSVESPR